MATNSSVATAEAGSPQVCWRDPRVDPPPRGVKLNAMTEGGIVIFGNWRDDYLAWSPLLKIPPWLRARLNEAYLRSDKTGSPPAAAPVDHHTSGLHLFSQG
mgnify:FL=1